ncbi:MAG: BON domain-containing protein [Pseudomonadota bacterium]
MRVEMMPGDLIELVSQELNRDTRIDTLRHPISLLFRDNTLVLEGTVEDIVAKKRAVSAAKRVAGEVPVIDRLRIACIEPVEDGALRNQALYILQNEPSFLDYGLRLYRNGMWEEARPPRADSTGMIEISAEGGVVRLSGQVGSLSHLRLAETLLWWIAGCELAENHLRVVPEELDNDDEISDAVRLILEKDPLVHASQLSIQVKDRVVTLEGFVASQEEKKLAALDAWYVPGVTEVCDNIQARI